jgi:hypothetical protein
LLIEQVVEPHLDVEMSQDTPLPTEAPVVIVFRLYKPQG